MRVTLLMIAVVLLTCPGCAGKSSPAAGTPDANASLAGEVFATGAAAAWTIAPDTLRAVSEETGTQLSGAAYSTELGCANAAVQDTSVVFTPVWGDGAHTLADAGYAVYAFEIADHAALNQLELGWTTAPATGELWVALADFTDNLWRWFQPDDTTLFHIADVSPYFNAGDTCYVVIAVLAGPAVLDTVTISEASGWQLKPVAPGGLWTGDMIWDCDGLPAAMYLSGYKVCFRRALDAGAETWGDEVVVEDIADRSMYAVRGAMVNGYPAAVWTRRAGESSLTDLELHYACATAADGSAWGTPQTICPNVELEDVSFSILEVDGRPGIAYLEFDGDQVLRYTVGDDAQGSGWSTPLTICTAWNTSQLALIDGRPAICSIVQVTDTYPYDMRFHRATDATGSAFGTELIVNTSSVTRLLRLAEINGLPALADGLKYYRATDVDGTDWSGPVTISSGLGVPTLYSLAEIDGRPALGAVEWFPYNSADAWYIRAEDATGSTWPELETVLHYDYAAATDAWYCVKLGQLLGKPAIFFGGPVEQLSVAMPY